MGFQLEVAKRIVTALRKIVLDSLPLCVAELHLEVAKCIVTLHEEKHWVEEATKQVAGKQLQA